MTKHSTSDHVSTATEITDIATDELWQSIHDRDREGIQMWSMALIAGSLGAAHGFLEAVSNGIVSFRTEDGTTQATQPIDDEGRGFYQFSAHRGQVDDEPDARSQTERAWNERGVTTFQLIAPVPTSEVDGDEADDDEQIAEFRRRMLVDELAPPVVHYPPGHEPGTE